MVAAKMVAMTVERAAAMRVEEVKVLAQVEEGAMAGGDRGGDGGGGDGVARAAVCRCRQREASIPSVRRHRCHCP